MIPAAYLTEWRQRVPWVSDVQVEQDLIISRALATAFAAPGVAEAFAFRGGTALYKLYLEPQRYSEDIDLVQVAAGPAGPATAALRGALDHWLGIPSFKQGADRFTLYYKVQSEGPPSVPLRLKVEVNTREHFALDGWTPRFFRVESRWFRGEAQITTYRLEELLGTKMRALHQRKKGRDLFDLWTALRNTQLDRDRIVHDFLGYMARGGTHATRAQFEETLLGKLADGRFRADVDPLLAADHLFDFDAAAATVLEQLVAILPGAPWRGP